MIVLEGYPVFLDAFECTTQYSSRNSSIVNYNMILQTVIGFFHHCYDQDNLRYWERSKIIDLIRMD